MDTPRYHVVMDCSEIRRISAGDLSGFLSVIPGRIGMSILHGPTVMEGIPENPGLTGFCIIDYSHISVHTFTLYGEAMVDIFSCKPYDIETCIAMVSEFLGTDIGDMKVRIVDWRYDRV